MTRTRLGTPVRVAAAVVLLGLSACTPDASAPAPTSSTTSPAATGAAPTTPSSSASARTAAPTVAEPTTTNTLPAPPRATGPAPSTAGVLTAKDLPVPAGWKNVVRDGGEEDGYEGNGTWVHGKDPRYAADGAVTIGCADVTRDDYTDPVAALEGTYAKSDSEPGIGLVLQFADPTAAQRFYTLYVAQVKACTDPDGPVVTEVVDSAAGLIDRRTYPEGDWTEVAGLRGSRMTMIILTDPGHAMSSKAAETLLGRLTAG